MGYAHIDNLYKNQIILMFTECYALEKVHGTSAHVRWKDGKIQLFSGGMSSAVFAEVFDLDDLTARFVALGHDRVTVYGEAYGGKEQGMSATYGKTAAFIAFEVQIGGDGDENGAWLNVENAHDVVTKLGLEFVPYRRGPAIVEWLDEQRDADSIVAERRGMGSGKKREGVVVRPLEEFRDHRGNRVVAKHKRDDFRETATPRQVVDPAKQQVLNDAEAIALEWVTDMRLAHVLDKIPRPHGMEQTPLVIAAMVEDVLREAAGEIVDSKPARGAISKRASALFKAHVQKALRGAS